SHQAPKPAGRTETRRYDDSARGVLLAVVADADRVTRRDVRAHAYEQIIHRVKFLAVVQLRLGHRHFSYRASVSEDLGQNLSQIANLERQQHTFPTRRIRVDSDDRLHRRVLHGVGDQPILTEHDNRILVTKYEVRQE